MSHDRIAIHLTKADFETLLYAWNAVEQDEYDDFRALLEKYAIKFGYPTLIEAEAAIFDLRDEDVPCDTEAVDLIPETTDDEEGQE